MTYEEALQYFEQTDLRGSYLGLDEISKVLDRLGNPEKQLKFVHIAGTNGKGSTATLVESCLRKAGYRVGLYTSPHLIRYNERFKVDGEEISNELLASATARVKEVVDTLEKAPTQFELMTCVGFCCFQEAGCDIVVLEVGLGGRSDTTNVIPVPEAAVITRIGLEHTEILGDTLEKITAEKAGIIKEGGTVILGDPTPEVLGVTAEICQKHHAELLLSDPAEAKPRSRSIEGQKFAWRQYSEICLSLLGSHQLQNGCTALLTIEALRGKGWKISDEAVLEGFRTAVWPGRFECVSKNPTVIIDGGHNQQCAEAIADALNEYFPGKKCSFLIGVMADKNFKGIFDALLPLAEKVYAVTPDSPRALKAPRLCEKLEEEYGYTAAKSFERLEDAMKELFETAQKDDLICICGSLYMVGDVKHLLKK